ncbi:hypothetical protein MS6_1227 [Vibrio cholerae MS6]|nr:hypothetical protein MS6_1227 [Vibrio cholerae MS6]
MFSFPLHISASVILRIFASSLIWLAFGSVTSFSHFMYVCFVIFNLSAMSYWDSFVLALASLSVSPIIF